MIWSNIISIRIVLCIKNPEKFCINQIKHYLCHQILEEGGFCPSFLFMIDKQIIKEVVEEFLMSSGNYLVDIEIKPDNTIIIEIDNDQAVSIDDCAALSVYIGSKIDRDKEDYSLEVGSAGLGQPFKIRRQYRKNIGNEIEVLTQSGVKHTGVLKTCDDEQIVLTIQKQVKPEGAKRKVTIEEDIAFRYDVIKWAKYSFK